MNRRQFVNGAGAVLGVSAIAEEARAADSAGESVSGAASAVYRRSLVVDGNLGPDFDDKLPLSRETLERIRSSGLTAIKTSLGGFDNTFDETLEEIAYYVRAIDLHRDALMQIRRASDFAAAKREKKLGIIFSFEGVEMLEGKIERVELFRNLGVRVMQLSYNKTSPFAAGVMAPASGLTELGAHAVEKMNEIGVSIDVSHANAKTTADVIAHSKQPVLITHGGCAAVYEHPRNKTDEQLRAVASKGGVVGIYDLPYLTPSPRQPTVEDYIAHMTHALNVCGEDHVGIGSDAGIGPFDTSPESMAAFNKDVAQRKAAGVSAPGEDRPPYVEGLNTPRRCEVIADALLKKGYPDRVAEKVLGANFVRFFSEGWKD